MIENITTCSKLHNLDNFKNIKSSNNIVIKYKLNCFYFLPFHQEVEIVQQFCLQLRNNCHLMTSGYENW